MKTLREVVLCGIEKAVDRCLESCSGFTIEQLYEAEADAAILALRQWMEDEGLTIVPDDVSNWHVRFTQFASGEVQSALDSAPDVLGKP